ncbi:MAG: porin family protein [Chitinophagia bacterium]|jgi:hypothetical protein
MKKTFFVALMLTVAGISYGQNTRFHIYTGYAFDDNIDSYFDNSNYYKGTIRGNYIWGGGIEFMPHRYTGFEVSYLRMDTDAPMTYYNGGVKNKTFNIGINNIMFGGNRYFSTISNKVEPYVGGMMGMTIFSIKNSDAGGTRTATKFGYGVKIGTNIYVTELVGIKLQAQLMSVAQAVGGGAYFGTGGSGVGITTYSSMLQIGLGGGLVFKLAPTKKYL